MQQEKEQQCLHHKIRKRLQEALVQYSMITDGDKILVALSGGKDSLCLLEFLSERQKIFKPKFNIEAVHVRMDNIQYESDTTYLDDFAKRCNVKLHILNTGFEFRKNSKKPACFLCSWYRRKAIFKFAENNGFNKIAIGHHMDDIIHTAMLNEFFQGTFATMPAVLKMQKMPLTIIRPLCLIKESDIREYGKMEEYKKQIKTCPFEKISNRETMRQVFDKIEKINPEARFSIWHALEKEGKLVQIEG